MARSRKTTTGVAGLPDAPDGFQTPDASEALPPPGEDRVVAIARDRRTVYVYWSLSENSVRRGAREGPGRLTLRIYTTGRGKSGLRATPIEDWVGERVVQVPAGCSVVAAVGFERAGSFAHLARAAAVRPPLGEPGGGETQMADGRTPEADTAALLKFSLSRARVGKSVRDLGELW